MNEQLRPPTAARFRIDARRAEVLRLNAAGMSNRAIGKTLGIDGATVRRDLENAEGLRGLISKENHGVRGDAAANAAPAPPPTTSLAESAIQARDAVLAALPTCGMSALAEFYTRTQQVAATTRAAGDSATAELWDDLCRRLTAEAQRRAAPAREGEPSEAR
jgi:DNA-binding CsgD family transcriptional regulator